MGLIPLGMWGGNPLRWIDPLGLDLTEAQKVALVWAAQDWANSNVPWVSGGVEKTGADCSGAITGILRDASINIGTTRLTSSNISTHPHFMPVELGDAVQVGDIAKVPGHLYMYGGSENTGSGGMDVWSTFNSGYFRPADSTNSYFTGPHTWYRYFP